MSTFAHAYIVRYERWANKLILREPMPEPYSGALYLHHIR